MTTSEIKQLAKLVAAEIRREFNLPSPLRDDAEWLASLPPEERKKILKERSQNGNP